MILGQLVQFGLTLDFAGEESYEKVRSSLFLEVLKYSM